MEKPESGVAVFFDSDGSLYWKTADGVVRRGAWVTDRDAVLGSSAVDIGVGSASTVCVRDGHVHLGAAPADGVRVADVAASLDRIAAALNNDPAPHAVVSEPTVPLDADGKPIVVGAFYVGSTCGPWPVKWKKEGGGWGARLNDNQVVYVEKNTPTEWVWFVVDEAKRSHEAEGYAPTKAQAKACAEAVAVAMGLVKAEAKPERELVAEWWEVQSRILGMGPWFSVRNGRCVSKTTAMAVKDQCGRGEYRIVHVRRYGVKKGKVKL